MNAELQVGAIGAVWAGVLGVIGVAMMSSWRRASVRGSLIGVAAVAVLAVVAGMLGAARAMFISDHDLGVVLLVSGVAGVVALGAALITGRRVVRDVEALRSRAHAVGAPVGEPGRSPAAAPRLTELAEIDAELAASRERLELAAARERTLEASRRELVAWVSHDLRTPLAGLRAMVEALEDGLVDDPARYHRQIRREVERLSRLVDDLFELSRLQAGAVKLALARVDMAALADDVVLGSGPAAQARGVQLGAKLDAAQLTGDPAGLGRVLSNLVANAVRHTPSDGTVLVTTTTTGSEVVLSVSDGCGGMSAEELDRAFEPGWRGTSARTPSNDGGAGLGLAIASGIVAMHHGRIDVHNTTLGCCFEVRIPVSGAR